VIISGWTARLTAEAQISFSLYVVLFSVLVPVLLFFFIDFGLMMEVC
jgi:hypothetical protein